MSQKEDVTQQDDKALELFTPEVINHLRKLGQVVSGLGGYGSIKIDIFRNEVAGCVTHIDTKQGYQF